MSPLFGSKQVKPFIDPSRGDAEAAALRQAAASGNWAAVDAALQATPNGSRREFLVDAIALDTSNLSWVDVWVKEQPSSAAARLMWGACAVQYAWKVRTGAAPQDVAPDKMAGFHDWLVNADEQLQHAATMAPEDGAPWIALLWAGVGLEIPIESATERWENVSRRNPATELGAMAYLTHIGPRWNGRADLMWTFIQDLLSRETDGSPRWFMVPHGHFEQWVAERMHGGSAVHPSRYFEQSHVQRDIIDAYDKYLGSASKRPSELEPQFRELFAASFYLMNARDRLRRELEQIGPGIQNLPWGFLGSTMVAYQSAREAAGLR